MYPILTTPTDYSNEALLFKSEYSTLTQHAAFVMHPDKRSKITYQPIYYIPATTTTTAASAVAAQATVTPTPEEPNIYLRNIATSNTKAYNLVVISNFKTFQRQVNNNYEHANRLVHNCMAIKTDEVAIKLTSGRNTHELMIKNPVYLIPGGTYQVMVCNYSEFGSIRKGRVESLSLGYFYEPWINKDNIKCIECVRDVETAIACFENHSKYLAYIFDVEAFRGGPDNGYCITFY